MSETLADAASRSNNSSASDLIDLDVEIGNPNGQNPRERVEDENPELAEEVVVIDEAGGGGGAEDERVDEEVGRGAEEGGGVDAMVEEEGRVDEAVEDGEVDEVAEEGGVDEVAEEGRGVYEEREVDEEREVEEDGDEEERNGILQESPVSLEESPPQLRPIRIRRPYIRLIEEI